MSVSVPTRYIAIECRTKSECATVMSELRTQPHISVSLVKGELELGDKFLAYFSTEAELAHIRTTLNKYRLIHNDVLHLSPKQQAFVRPRGGL